MSNQVLPPPCVHAEAVLITLVNGNLRNFRDRVCNGRGFRERFRIPAAEWAAVCITLGYYFVGQLFRASVQCKNIIDLELCKNLTEGLWNGGQTHLSQSRDLVGLRSTAERRVIWCTDSK